MGASYFLLKGKRKVDGEFALFATGYNLSRAENMSRFLRSLYIGVFKECIILHPVDDLLFIKFISKQVIDIFERNENPYSLDTVVDEDNVFNLEAISGLLISFTVQIFI